MSDPRPRVSVVIVAYDMAPQLRRTLLSLSPRLQEGVGADDYELIVVDNGSPEPVLEADYEDLGARLRCLRIEDAPPSPARAINVGIEAARAPLIGVMIDGARMATPGILRYALMAASLGARPLVITLGFHLGRKPQPEAVRQGYDADAEQGLLDSIDWPSDPYRLFEISVPGGSSSYGWFRIPTESNALFLSADLWADLGGYDERYTTPGGGLVNLDTFERACRLPEVEPTVLLGEGTFHQVHGGVATNSPSSMASEYMAEHERIRGRKFVRPRVSPLYLGKLSAHAISAGRRGRDYA